MTVFSYNRRKNGGKGAKRPLRQRCAAAFSQKMSQKGGQKRASFGASSSTSCITDTSKAVRCSLPPSGSFFV